MSAAFGFLAIAFNASLFIFLAPNSSPNAANLLNADSANCVNPALVVSGTASHIASLVAFVAAPIAAPVTLPTPDPIIPPPRISDVASPILAPLLAAAPTNEFSYLFTSEANLFTESAALDTTLPATVPESFLATVLPPILPIIWFT